MAVLRLDVQRNIERLQDLYLLNPSKYSTLEEILEKEVEDNTAKKVDSCARAVLWLSRSMDFTIALLQRLEEDSDQKCFGQLVESAYMVTLKPWHGWISSAAYKIAMKLIPDRKMFISLLVGKCQDYAALKEEIRKLAKLLQPFLDDIHAMMAKFRLDRLKST
uniref:Glycolipid transfer protein domain-containing protein n=2 Tax=Oryza brachyantha TaxID=4533 RepID=J3LY43_ORYBR